MVNRIPTSKILTEYHPMFLSPNIFCIFLSFQDIQMLPCSKCHYLVNEFTTLAQIWQSFSLKLPPNLLALLWLEVRIVSFSEVYIMSCVNYSKIKLTVGEVGHQKGVVKFCEWTGRTCHITISNDMFVGLSLAARAEVRISDAPLFQVCCQTISS